jgi:hypothetical protein
MTLTITDCSSTLTLPSAADAVSLLYSSSDLSDVIHPSSGMSSSDWDSYLTNSDTSNCPITTCSLFEAGCSTLLSSPVSMEASTPWDVTALTNFPAGYTQSMCVECTNGAQTVQIDNWSMT